jgi:hypothetical protein
VIESNPYSHSPSCGVCLERRRRTHEYY